MKSIRTLLIAAACAAPLLATAQTATPNAATDSRVQTSQGQTASGSTSGSSTSGSIISHGDKDVNAKSTKHRRATSSGGVDNTPAVGDAPTSSTPTPSMSTSSPNAPTNK